MIKRAMTTRLIAALAFALVLSMQSVVSAYALGVANDTPQLDSFGNPLCLNGPGHDGSGSGAPDHSKLPPCCTFACSMFWPGMPASVGLASITPSIQVVSGIVYFSHRTTPRSDRTYEPGNPRAPPLTV
ncbi:hypothetical protein [Ciceribacter azotifigens]|uniref:hypothetical protein n=1 Tax=Ciceribacter azotifigens TaxID=2069303 RepID=UPI003A8A0507